MNIMIGNDHGGYYLKKSVVELLQSLEINVIDIGCDSDAIVRYPYYAARVSQAVSSGEVDRGILICSTGIGMSVAANRHRGVRASLCTDSYMAKMTRAHNDSNLLCLGGRITGDMLAMEIVRVWLETPYEGGRHDISLGLIQEMEKTITTESVWKWTPVEGEITP